MKSIFSIGIGFLIARQIYINYDKKEARRKEHLLKMRLKKILEDNGVETRELETLGL